MKTLAIKYRPSTFDDVVEQGPIKQILQDQLETKTHKNCYLFTGGAGTGKTTIARIFANELNGRTGNPIEIDAASNNGVDNVREIIDNAKFKALDAPYKVYIIDECHMLSTGAWNAMLKLIEEPPAQTVFIFCTTDPQKIPPTILSRVQRYDFRRISHDSIVERLRYIVEEENLTEDVQGSLTYETAALDYVAKLADGGMRDAITLLDKCVSYAPDITEANVVAALGTVNFDVMLGLSQALAQNDLATVVRVIETTHREGVDLKQFMKQYANYVLDLCKYDLIGNFDYLQIPSTYQSDLSQMREDYFVYFHELLPNLVKLNAEAKWETAPKALIEATLFTCGNKEAL